MLGGLDRNKCYLSDSFFLRLPNNLHWQPMILRGRTFPRARVDSAHWVMNDKLYIWGGACSTSLLSDLWALDFTEQEWTKISQSGIIPSSRQSPSVVVNGTDVYMFGGASRTCRCNDLWKLSLLGNVGTWTKIESNKADSAPSPHLSSGIRISGGHIYVFGGSSLSDRQHMSVFQHSTVANSGWVDLTLVSGSIFPTSSHLSNLDFTPIYKHTTDCSQPSFHDTTFTPHPVSDPTPPRHCYEVNSPHTPRNSLPLPRDYTAWTCKTSSSLCFGFGGYAEGLSTNPVEEIVLLDFDDADQGGTTVKYQIHQNIQSSNAGQATNTPSLANSILSPLNRYSAAIPPLTTDNTFYLYGGVHSGTIDGHLIKISLDTPTPTYTLLSNSIDGVPTPRINHRSVSAFGRFWVFGGRNDEKLLLNDLHSFVPTNHSWEQHTDTGLEAPTAREDMSLCEHAGSLFMFGGHGMDSNGEENRLNDLWQFSIERNRWTKLVPLSEDMPAGVKGAAMILLHQQLHVFGGRFSDESVSNELWVFSLVESKWTHLNGSFKPNILENSASPLSPEPSLAAREQPAIWTKTIEIDGEERDLLLVCAGLSETDQSILTIDRIILASEYSLDQNFVFTTPFSFPASAFPKNPIGIAACTVVVEDGIVSMGGLDGDELRPFWTYWKVSELTLDSSDAKYEVQTASGRISSGSVALLGRQVFMFGGSVSEGLRADPTRNHNRMFISTLTDTFRCSPGTVVDSSATSSAGCSITPAGTFARKFGTISPTLCSAGTTNRFEGATRGYHCVSCPAGSFAGTDGSSTCTPCTDPNGWCPVGSRVGNATIPSEPNGMTSRVQDFHTLDELQALNLLIPLFGVLIGIVVASCFLWCPCSKKWFWRLDWMDGYHHTRVNRVTRVSEKVLRKSLLGACLFVIFVFFTVGTITSILLEFFLNNKFESTTMIVEMSLPSDPTMKVMETPTAELGLVINQMNRQCTLNDTLAEEEGRIGWAADGELCSEEIKVHFGRIQTNSPPTIACRLLSTNTTLRYSPTVDCLLSISLDTPTFEFDVTAPAPSISFEVDNPEAVAYGLAAFMRTETSREKDTNSPNETISGLGSFIVDSQGLMFKGPTPTVFSFDLQRSRYKAADNELSYGLFVSSADVTAGSTSDFDELYSNFGLAVQFEFVRDAQIILIDRVYRQKVAELLATLFSTALGFFGAFGALVKVGEKMQTLNFKPFKCCCRLFAEDIRYLESERQPLISTDPPDENEMEEDSGTDDQAFQAKSSYPTEHDGWEESAGQSDMPEVPPTTRRSHKGQRPARTTLDLSQMDTSDQYTAR
ncbi:hypothetical protein BLNAU_14376 [Blattamonas nauphoetae]|uniref:Tyrosine-protein kinase ephrin type A/B receptor-like domain-containing protein n=1 Tax=Blattamonas nauphoetae TaxID=2049346 RepID=A0ABQ9XH13_9EUKA|nr:hypothetical protein BLNAU_14376 [Blattamonas nauphoetae]